MKKLTDFRTTSGFFKHLNNLVKNNESKRAGLLYEDYLLVFHAESGEYIDVYDTNKRDLIPAALITKIDAWELLDKKDGDSFKIDMIGVTRTGEIDIHQHKYTRWTQTAAFPTGVNSSPLPSLGLRPPLGIQPA